MESFRAFKTPGLAHTAYFFASAGLGVLVDPRRDVADYVDFAMEQVSAWGPEGRRTRAGRAVDPGRVNRLTRSRG
jgi:hypothetical protein